MIITLEILLALVAIICFLGGVNILLKGAMSFLPQGTPPQLVLDNLVRFLAGIYFGCGFLLAYSCLNVESIGNIVYFLGGTVLFSGLGRLLSRTKLGSAGKYFDFIMIVEILLGLSIIALKWLM